MTQRALRLWFAFAVAVIGAAIADPCVEALSNAGRFGPGRYTDGSNLDVVPALIVGVLLLAVHASMRVRGELLRNSGDALRGMLHRLYLPAFAMQITVLLAMETLEQLAIAGRVLGGALWLGGPALWSLSIHALVCAVVTLILAAFLRVFTRRTVRAVRLLRALLERALHGDAPIARRSHERVLLARIAPVYGRAGDRAPPLAIA